MSDLAKAITELVKTADDGFVEAIAQHTQGNHTAAGHVRNAALDAVESARILLLTVATPLSGGDGP